MEEILSRLCVYGKFSYSSCIIAGNLCDVSSRFRKNSYVSCCITIVEFDCSFFSISASNIQTVFASQTMFASRTYLISLCFCVSWGRFGVCFWKYIHALDKVQILSNLKLASNEKDACKCLVVLSTSCFVAKFTNSFFFFTCFGFSIIGAASRWSL